MENNGEGHKSCFSDFFMENIRYGKVGQFFTSEHICELSTRVQQMIEDGSIILDCSCDSGQKLLADL